MIYRFAKLKPGGHDSEEFGLVLHIIYKAAYDYKILATEKAIKIGFKQVFALKPTDFPKFTSAKRHRRGPVRRNVSLFQPEPSFLNRRRDLQSRQVFPTCPFCEKGHILPFLQFHWWSVTTTARSQRTPGIQFSCVRCSVFFFANLATSSSNNFWLTSSSRLCQPRDHMWNMLGDLRANLYRCVKWQSRPVETTDCRRNGVTGGSCETLCAEPLSSLPKLSSYLPRLVSCYKLPTLNKSSHARNDRSRRSLLLWCTRLNLMNSN